MQGQHVNYIVLKLILMVNLKESIFVSKKSDVNDWLVINLRACLYLCDAGATTSAPTPGAARRST
jgi:hypothetical protein